MNSISRPWSTAARFIAYIGCECAKGIGCTNKTAQPYPVTNPPRNLSTSQSTKDKTRSSPVSALSNRDDIVQVGK